MRTPIRCRTTAPVLRSLVPSMALDASYGSALLADASAAATAAPVDAFSSLLPAGASSWGQALSEQLNIGRGLESVVSGEQTSLVLDTLGHDLLIFLTAAVCVVPLARTLNISPILAYLLVGGILGPHGMGLFSNAEADVELGDFGILFLLFSEGLEVSSERLSALSKYVPLGLAQISLTAGVLTFAILGGLPETLDLVLPLDSSMIDIHNPSEALILALAGTLSTSAFVFPALQDKEWEDTGAGQAATSILLLQDLAVAPLLVLLPFVVGQGMSDPTAVAFLTLKATVGFGSVVFAGSFLLRRVFELVSQAKSTETFVVSRHLPLSSHSRLAHDGACRRARVVHRAAKLHAVCAPPALVRPFLRGVPPCPLPALFRRSACWLPLGWDRLRNLSD